MRNLSAVSVGTLLFAAIVFARPIQAMEIIQFDKMADRDQSDYITLLVEGAQKVLIDQGKDASAAQIHKLFTEVPRGDTIALGLEELETNLAQARLADAERHAKDDNAQRLEVEHAMIVTLQKNGIVLPKSFMAVANGFKPKFSVR